VIIPPEDWLHTLNRKFREGDVDVRQRPFLALDHYCKDFRVISLSFDSPPAKAIFEWFSAHSKPQAHEIGSLFKGAFYYDSCFWPVDIFIGYGTFELNALTSLQSMSDSMKAELMSIPNVAWSYVLTWADTADYGYGIDDLDKTLPVDATYARSLLENADRELRAAVAQLLEHRPNAKAAMSCRMATEIFLKAFLVLKASLSESQIRAFNHYLDKLLAKIRELHPAHDVLSIEHEIAAFPTINDRYTGAELAPSALWGVYQVSLFVAATVVRSFADRNIRSSVLAQQNAR
jgi:hypothetical protein